MFRSLPANRAEIIELRMITPRRELVVKEWNASRQRIYGQRFSFARLSLLSAASATLETIRPKHPQPAE